MGRLIVAVLAMGTRSFVSSSRSGPRIRSPLRRPCALTVRSRWAGARSEGRPLTAERAVGALAIRGALIACRIGWARRSA